MQHNVSVTQRHNNEPDIFINFHSYIEEVYLLMLMTESAFFNDHLQGFDSCS